jgi:hypothetical protein
VTILGLGLCFGKHGNDGYTATALPHWTNAMIRIAVHAAVLAWLTAAPVAAEEEPLRLTCRAGDVGFNFSIDLTASDAVETVSGRRLAVSALRDHLVLSDQGTPVFRIDRITGAFVVTRQLPMTGTCEKVGRKF